MTGPTGSGQDHDAVFGAGRNQRAGREHLDRRRSDRIRPAGRHADSGELRDRPDVRGDPAGVPAAGSRRHARRRNARQGNRAHRGRSGAHRPSGFHDAPHQQRGGGVYAARRDGHRAVPRVIFHDRRHRPAACAPPVPELPGAVRGGCGHLRVPRACRLEPRSSEGVDAMPAEARESRDGSGSTRCCE